MGQVARPRDVPSTDGTVEWFVTSVTRSWKYQAHAAGSFLAITWPVLLVAWAIPGGLVSYVTIAGLLSISTSAALRKYEIDYEALIDKFDDDTYRRPAQTSLTHLYVIMLFGGTFFVGLATLLSGIVVFMTGVVAPGFTLIPAIVTPVFLVYVEEWDVKEREQSIVARGLSLGESALKLSQRLTVREQQRLPAMRQSSLFIVRVAFDSQTVQSDP